jgi:hypothetical protein
MNGKMQALATVIGLEAADAVDAERSALAVTDTDEGPQ